jgi:hypothetical protein
VQFPVYLWLGPLALHPHPVFDTLAIGLVQLVYGSVMGALAFLFGARATAIAQGILIGTGLVTLLFTVLCFAGATIG